MLCTSTLKAQFPEQLKNLSDLECPIPQHNIFLTSDTLFYHKRKRFEYNKTTDIGEAFLLWEFFPITKSKIKPRSTISQNNKCTHCVTYKKRKAKARACLLHAQLILLASTTVSFNFCSEFLVTVCNSSSYLIHLANKLLSLFITCITVPFCQLYY